LCHAPSSFCFGYLFIYLCFGYLFIFIYLFLLWLSFEICSCFMPGLTWTAILFVLPAIAGKTGMFHGAQPLVEMGLKDFLPGLALN
jgi:hypothetical protein